MTQRTKPYSLESEESLLGNVLVYGDAMRQAVEANLLSEDFYFEKHRKIFTIMYTMYERGEDIDATTLQTRTKDYGIYEQIGGIDFLLHLTNITISSAHTKEYIKIIKDKSYARKIIDVANNIANDGYDGAIAIEELLDEAERKILDVTRSRAYNEFKSSDVVFEDALGYIHRIAEHGDTVTGIRTTYSDLDRLTTGFQKGDLIILAARPSVGKSAFALNIALNVAALTSGAVAIFSLEMPADQLAMRMLMAKSKISGQKLRTGRLDNKEWSTLNEVVGELKHQKFFIDDSASIKVSEIFAKCRALKNDNGLSLVIIDYLQLIQGSGRSESRQVEVSEISRRLKGLARDLEVPVIALSQLSRSVESRNDKKPMLSDLRESGSIEQDADLVMFLYRESYYNRDEDPPMTEEVEVNLAKHRNGPTGIVKLVFERDINRFYSSKIEGK